MANLQLNCWKFKFTSAASPNAATSHALKSAVLAFARNCVKGGGKEGAMTQKFEFKVSATDGQARTGVISTPRGDVRT
ncbi:MAG: hypothetical protein ACRC6I_13515, partial [Paracoccaceae bacterium]